MFKPLIKKVREESSNSSILPENNSDETNGNLNKENNSSLDDEHPSASRTHRKSFEIPPSMTDVLFYLKDDLIPIHINLQSTDPNIHQLQMKFVDLLGFVCSIIFVKFSLIKNKNLSNFYLIFFLHISKVEIPEMLI
jgi:hypothetical protein